jgi:hypothetical protein
MHMDTVKTSNVIDALGGTNAVARICDIRSASVSGWRKLGMPRHWEAFFRLRNPEIFKSLEAAK